ncbi:endolytic transglycosylase MltG [Thiorhodococcus mannitoliphagus]|uniref:Endolytic murein transglycosylase n=1 Tax=Thiorhodococcus mannitoliphagus TaxID=329406 RepID=A0A6P1DTK0_9GAMM|nr:endolytic transglycosylase MltG [Thiorhodococcus mannitoliphagus]NEX21129.1 endolytic transglycosylase MltG [Thiorhodococcus mannitoliphagus]
MTWRIGFLVLLFSAGLLGGGLWVDYQRFLSTAVGVPEPEPYLDIPRGTSLRALSAQMAREGILEQPYYFIVLAYLEGAQRRIKAGEYAVAPGMTPAALLGRITEGKVVQFAITLVEGRTFRQALATIDAHEHFGGDALSSLTDAELMAELGRPGEHPEGRFFPDTYLFPRKATGLDVLRRAMERMDRVLAEEWSQREPRLPIDTAYEALILASIIEKETAKPEERPAIGGVFARRLQQGMKLQTDPTVIYGMGERYDGDIRRADLREPTPYNTYVIQGLPPTPIALPGRAAIHAALHPAEGDALYFVARGDGSHVFSRTLEEHQRAVRRYILSEGG